MDFAAIFTGALGVLAALVVKPVAAWITGADSKLVAIIKPFQPIIALGLALVIGKACIAVGLTGVCPTPEQLLTAPIGTVAGITVLEIVKKLRGLTVKTP